MNIGPNITAQVLREAADEITSYEVADEIMETAPGWPHDTQEVINLVAGYLREKADRLVREARGTE